MKPTLGKKLKILEASWAEDSVEKIVHFPVIRLLSNFGLNFVKSILKRELFFPETVISMFGDTKKVESNVKLSLLKMKF